METNLIRGSRFLLAVQPAGAVLLAVALLATAPHARAGGMSVNEHGRDLSNAYAGRSAVAAGRVDQGQPTCGQVVGRNESSADIVGLQLTLDL